MLLFIELHTTRITSQLKLEKKVQYFRAHVHLISLDRRLDPSREHFAHITQQPLPPFTCNARPRRKFSSDNSRNSLFHVVFLIFASVSYLLVTISAHFPPSIRSSLLSFSSSLFFSRTTSLITAYFNTIRVTPTIERITIKCLITGAPAEIIFLKRRMHDQLYRGVCLRPALIVSLKIGIYIVPRK